MIHTQEATGKTVDEARAKACALLGVQAEDLNVSYEVLEMPQKTGFLGLKLTPAKVRVSVEEPDVPAAPIVEEAPAPAAEEKVEAPAEEAAAPAPALLAQRGARQIVQRLDGLPGGLVAHACATGRFGDGADVADAPQDVNALVGELRHVSRQKRRVGNRFAHACLRMDYLKNEESPAILLRNSGAVKAYTQS